MHTPSQPPHTVDALLRVIEVREAEVVLLKLMIDKLKLQLLRRVRAQFGPSSEQLDDPQIALIEGVPLYELPAPKKPAKADAANTPEADRKLPAHLPREAKVYRPEAGDDHHDAKGQACGCTACGGRLRLIGQDISEQLEYVPAHFKVIRHVRPKLACVACEAIFQAAAPSRPIARGIAGPGLIAHVMVSKYCDHIPLYRQSGIYARDGVFIDRSTMAGWVDNGDALLDPLVAALGRYALAGAKVHADDTPVGVLDPGRGRTKTGRLWVYVRDDRPAGSDEAPAVWFQYSPDRKGIHPQKHLKNFSGILQADAYSGWGKLYDSGCVTEAACWAHARRPWWNLHLSSGRAPGTVAEQALKRIAALYAIEADIRGQPPRRTTTTTPGARRASAVEHRRTRRRPTTSSLSMATKVQRIKAPGAILQLHIELRGTKPKVWRRVLVPETITLVKLHLVIQAAFGWGHSHLHEFVAGDGERYGTPDPMYDTPGSITSENTRLTTALRKATLNYVYDFGDYWDHRIKLEKTLAPVPELALPFCVGGANAAPPEDCGGVPGYAEFVQAMADPDDPEHANLAEWLGADTWDPAAFDSIEVNDRLAGIKV